MELEPYRIFISATESGSRGGDRKVLASYALRIFGNSIDKLLRAKSRELEVQTMYAKGLEEACNFLWAEIDDEIANARQEVEIIVFKPKMKVRFDLAENSLFEKTQTGHTSATDNIETWLANAVWATHFRVGFREPDGDFENSTLRDIERLAKAELRSPRSSDEL